MQNCVVRLLSGGGGGAYALLQHRGGGVWLLLAADGVFQAQASTLRPHAQCTAEVIECTVWLNQKEHF